MVMIYEAAPLFMPRKDRDIADTMAKVLQAQGVELMLNAKVQSVLSQENTANI